MNAMLPNLYPFFIILLAGWLFACGDQYKNPIAKECKELCEVGTACLEGEEFDIDQCRTYCGIEQWDYLCLGCRLIEDCEEMEQCIFKYCDMRPMIDQCELLCQRAEECLDEYLDVENCIEDCATDKDKYACLDCLNQNTCTNFLTCGEKHCDNDWLQFW